MELRIGSWQYTTLNISLLASLAHDSDVFCGLGFEIGDSKESGLGSEIKHDIESEIKSEPPALKSCCFGSCLTITL